MRQFVQSLSDHQEGQALVEYALVLSLVSVASILVLTDLGSAIVDVLQQLVDTLS
jgi:Flp pilus assembly pilin Flp